MESVLTKEQVAEILGVTVPTVRNLMKRGELPYIKYGAGRRSPVRFDRDDIRAWLDSRKQGTGA